MVVYSCIVNVFKNKALMALMFFFAANYLLLAQYDKYDKIEFERLSVEDGLSSNMINNIVSDKHGFIWIGTIDGLNKFDGHKITTYRTNVNDSTTISDNHILALVVDSKDRLWVYTPFGMNLYDDDFDHFVRFGSDQKLRTDYATNEISSIIEDRKGNLWFVDNRNGLVMFDPQSFVFEKHTAITSRVGAIHIDQDGIIWVGTLEGELFKYNEVSSLFILVVDSEGVSRVNPQNQILSIISDRDKTLLIGGSRGIYRYDVNRNRFSPTNIISHQVSSFRNNEVRCMYAESDNILLVGTWGKGLGVYDRGNQFLKTYVVEPNNSTSLGNNDVNAIYKDTSGVIWIGTQDGVSIIDPARGAFSHFQNIPGDPNSLSFNFITSFCEDKSGKIWIGTYGDGINLFDPLTRSFSVIKAKSGQPNSLSNNAIRAISIDPSGYVWIASMKGINRYNPRNGNFLHFQHESGNLNSLSGNDILTIVNGKNGDLWVGTYGDGLNRITPVSPERGEYKITRFANIQGNYNSLTNNYVRSLHVDGDGIVWIGTLGGGLDRFNPNDGSFRNYAFTPNAVNSLSNKNVNCIIEDRKGYLWIGTWNGLNRFDKIQETFLAYYTQDGLPDNAISEVQQDWDGNLWVSTFKGLTMFNPDGNPMFIHFTPNYGLQGNKFNINASLKASDGTLYFGGTNGFNVFHPNDIIVNQHRPNVVFTGIMVNNKAVPVGEKEKGIVYLQRSITKTQTINLYHDARNITLEFAALSYSMRIKNQYAYKLEGYDDDWIYTASKNNVANYSSLPTGQYVLRVKAANSSGLWNEEGAMLRIRVFPPPWKTWWALCIYLFFIGVVLYFARTITVSQTNLKTNLRFEQLEREKIEAINNMKLNFFTNISHEFKTPLTLIVGPIQKILSDYEVSKVVKDQLLITERNSKRLLHLVNQLMEFRKIETDAVKIEVSEGDIIEKLETVIASFREMADEHSIKFEMVSNVNHRSICFDGEKVETIMYNLLSNAFKFTPAKGCIKVVVYDPSAGEDFLNFTASIQHDNAPLFATILNNNHKINEFLHIAVIDSGIGIQSSKLHKIFDRFYKVKKATPFHHSLSHTGTGIGLNITKNLVEMHHGEIYAESLGEKGTCVSICLPTGATVYSADEFSDCLNEAVHEIVPESFFADIESEILEEKVQTRLASSSLDMIPEQRKTVLIIDDSHDIVNFISGNLESDYDILKAYNGGEGFELASENVPDLIISDIMMPVLDGIELCEKLKSDIRTSHIPIILLTAFSSVEHYVSGMENGADDYIPKPFNINLLSLRVKNIIQSREHLYKVFSSDIAIQARKITFNTLDEKFLKNAVALIEKNLDNPEFNVDTFGQEIGMSRTNLFRKLKALTNQSASEFIRNIKIKKAAQFMLEGYNVSEVSDMVGINSRAYFKKCFMEQFGVGPSEFIKQYVKNQGEGSKVVKLD
jgi:ligand-binding sensor domain-containing protein/signal transduction histidine kinase/DNA-binding response OmpR family regulator